MVNRTRFLLDLDSEGFPVDKPYGIAAWMIGTRYDGQVQAGLLADVRCHGCKPMDQSLCTEPRCVLHGTRKASIFSGCMCDPATENPEGWREVDGVKLPSVVSWAELDHDLAQMAVNTPINCEDCCPDGECIAERVLRSGRAM